MIASAFSDQQFLALAEKLPTAPRVLVELGEALEDPSVEQRQVVGLVRRDPSLVAGILRMANSAAYAPASPIGSLERAVAFVGFAEVHRFVGVLAAQQLADQPLRLYPMQGHHLREHTLLTALLVEELAVAAREHHSRSCYTAGLLRTIGIMVLERAGDLEPRIPPFRESGEATIEAWERRFFGQTNYELAEKILKHWRMPHETVSAVRHHVLPGGRHNPLIHLLRLGVVGANDRLSTLSGLDEAWVITDENFLKAGLGERRFMDCCERAQRKFNQLRSAVA